MSAAMCRLKKQQEIVKPNVHPTPTRLIETSNRFRMRIHARDDQLHQQHALSERFHEPWGNR